VHCLYEESSESWWVSWALIYHCKKHQACALFTSNIDV
jgi:hypothetical protein